MPQQDLRQRMHRTTDLCDELAHTMSQIQSRLETRRSRMKSNMARMARGLKVQRPA